MKRDKELSSVMQGLPTKLLAMVDYVCQLGPCDPIDYTVIKTAFNLILIQASYSLMEFDWLMLKDGDFLRD